MKIEALAIFILSLLYRLDAKAFQTDGNAGGNEYANHYPEKTGAGYLSSSGVYSDGSRNYEMRYVPYVDGQPIFIPPVDFNQLTFPSTPTLKPKQWQSRFQHLKTSYPYPKADLEQGGHYSKPNREVKLEKNKYHSQPVTYDSVKSLTKATEIMDKIGKKQDKKPYSNLKKSNHPSTDAVNYDYDSPQISRPHTEKEIKQTIKHTKGQSNSAYHEYDLPEVTGAISKGQQTDLIKNDAVPISDKGDYDYPEVVNSLTKKDSSEDYDNPIVKRPVDKKAVKEKQVYNQYGSKENKYIDSKPKSPNKVGSHTKQSSEIKGTPKTYSSDSVLVKPTTFKIPTTSIKPAITKKHSKKEPTKPFKPEMKEKHYYQNTNDKKKYNYSTKNSVSDFKYESIKKPKVDQAAVENRNGEVTDMYDYDSPDVVEVLVKKNYLYDGEKPKSTKETLGKDNLSDDNSDYESPIVVEALTKKKPVKSSENIETIKVQNETEKPNTAKESEYQSYKYPIYFESKKPKDGTKHTALTLQTPSPIIGLNDNLDDSIFSPLTEFPENEKIESEMLSDESDRFDGSGLVDARTSNEEDSRSFKSSVWSLMSNFHSQERNKFKKCLTPDKEPGNCMPIQMCPVPNLQLTLDDLLKKVCTIDEVFIGICCPEFPAETLKVQWDNINQNWTDSEGNHSAKPEECGQYIESGKVQSWPWMAPLISVSTRRIFCGGVLIKEQYVLTAAHCTRKIPKNQILVVLGPLSSERDPTNQEFAVVEIKRHAQYNPRTMQNDIALLKLSRKVPLDDKRRFICLPKEEETNVGDEALMLGWQGSFVASKNEESLKVISQESCRKGVKFLVGPNVMCTEPRTEDVMCNLDSGAPLTVKKDGKYHVVGLMTWNRNDCDSNFPTIFTRVSHFKKWIENHSSS